MSDQETDNILESSEFTSGSVNDLKEELEEKDPEIEVLHQILDSEKDEKNRKTAIEAIEKRIFLREVREVLDTDEKEIENLSSIKNNLSDMEELERLNNVEDINRGKMLGSFFGNVEEAKKSLKDVDLSSEEAENLVKLEISGKNRDEVKDILKNQIEYFNSDKQDIWTRKKELRDELDISVSDKWLKDVPLYKLEKTAEEKAYRENMISDLKTEIDEPDEELKKMSTRDLEKICEEVI